MQQNVEIATTRDIPVSGANSKWTTLVDVQVKIYMYVTLVSEVFLYVYKDQHNLFQYE